MLIKNSLRSNYIVEESTNHKESIQPKISKKKKVNATNNKETNEKVLVSRKLQENLRKDVKTKNKKKNKWKSKKKCRWGGRAKGKFKKFKINENQRKSMSKEEVE